jgi:hypothetical protein
MSARAAHARNPNANSNAPSRATSTSTEHRKRNERNEKARSAQAVQAGVATAGRPGNLKIRAYSAPMVPKNRVAGTEQYHEGDLLAGDLEPGDDITDDPFFREYDFPQTGPGEKDDEESSSSADSSSDTEGPLSPTHLKNRQQQQQQALADSQPSPRSPVLSVAVGLHFLRLRACKTKIADIYVHSLETATLQPPCRTSTLPC